MLHYVFAWQVAGLMMGAALLAALVAAYGARGGARGKTARAGRLPPAFPLALILMIARTVLFSTQNYDEAAGVGIFPRYFLSSPLAGFFYVGLASAASWLLVAGFSRLSGRRVVMLAAIPYWGYVGIALFFLGALGAGLDFPWYIEAHLSTLSLAILPFAFAKGLAALCLLFLVVFRKRKGGEGMRLLDAAMVAAVLSLLGELWFRLDEGPYLVLIPLYYLGFYASLLLVILERRRGAASEEAALPGAEEGGAFEALAVAAGLDEGERVLLVLVLRGHSNKEIAAELGLGLSAVKHRLQRLFGRIGVQSRSGLLAKAARVAEGGIARRGDA